MGRLNLRLALGRIRSAGYGFAFLAVMLTLLTGVLAPLLDERHITNVSLLYLLLTLIVAAGWGYRAGLVAAVFADLAVNFFFLPPLHRFTVQETPNVISLVLFLAVAVVGASMFALLRREALRAEARRAEAVALLDLAQEMVHMPTPQLAIERLCFVTLRVLQARSVAVLRQEQGGWLVVATTAERVAPVTREEGSIATEVAASREIGRSGGVARSRSRPGHAEPVTYVPLTSATGLRAVLQVSGRLHPPPFVEAERLLFAFAGEAALALERTRLSEEASQAEALRRADELKTVLLSSVSHDLRSPLTAIKAAVGNLRDDTVEWQAEDDASFLDVIESQTDRLTATVTNLLEMSRLEGGVVHPVLEAIEVAPLLADAAAATRNVTTGRAVSIDAQPDTWVRADYGLLLQALTNLIENAARYSATSGGITLSAKRSGQSVILSVADAGPGIAEGDLPRIFEKFYRGATGVNAKGSGLGLSIVRAMVELCGGRVSVTSSADGSIFSLQLPVAIAPRR